MAREAREEIGVRIKPIKKLTTLKSENRNSILHWWLVEVVQGEPRINNDEHTEIAWLDFDEILKIEPIFQEDIAIYRLLASE